MSTVLGIRCALSWLLDVHCPGSKEFTVLAHRSADEQVTCAVCVRLMNPCRPSRPQRSDGVWFGHSLLPSCQCRHANAVMPVPSWQCRAST